MKKILLYVIAIPVGLIASMLLPAFISKIFDWFIPFDGINMFLDNYFLKFIGGWIVVGFTAMIVPKYKLIFGTVMLMLNFVASYYIYSQGDDFNYLFVLGGIIALILVGTQFSKMTQEE
ncbi:hypothetical protein [Cellulophaga baltica]|uniref:hypothetical protein n=1 Tax=Cellulophaga baltica TaxID=76594 RepID=UPI00042201D0|nr:hypothetical protein [Cellulophaga baltica]